MDGSKAEGAIYDLPPDTKRYRIRALQKGHPFRITVSVMEGGSAIFQVKLDGDPGKAVSVTVGHHSGDPDLSVVAGLTYIFDSINWDEYQQVTAAKMMAISGGKNLHPLSTVVGGVTGGGELSADREFM